ncbi:MAG: NAD(P)/FAD-dependent oxidoreductase [Saprospiraceae bacterium]|nr:NAD(P)/FAD-dependent oxidoreductase [Saprospiraceae bacterium]
MQTPKEIIIVGGGIAGLSAGIYAQLNGFNATILEMHDKPGGQLTAWDREGYRFDYCLHWLVGTDHGTYHDIWKELDVITDEVEVINHRIFVKLVDPKWGEFIIYNDLDEWEEYLVKLAPSDKRAIHKMCQMMRKSDRLDQFEDPPGMRSLFDYFKSFVRMGSFFPILIWYGQKNCNELFDSLGFEDERLLHFLHQLFGGQDFSALGFLMMLGWAHAKNAGYLKGGSLEMTKRMANKFKALGGKFAFEKKVNKLLIHNDQVTGVQLEDHGIYYGDHIIWAADGHYLLFDLLPDEFVDAEFKEAYQTWPLFTPVVMVGIGVNKEINTDTHNTTYLAEGLTIGSTSVSGYSIMNRSSYDPIFSPKGKTALQLQFESPWSVWENLKGEAYVQEKQQIEKDIRAIVEKHFPGITEHIEVIDIATPQTTVRYTGVWKGAYEGFMPNKDVLNGLPMELSKLKNFSMVGQWLFPGGGLPPSAQSGKWVIHKLKHETHEKFQTT